MFKNLAESLYNRLNQIFIFDQLQEDSLNDADLRAKILVGVLIISALSGLGLVIALGAAHGSSGEPLLLVATLIASVTVMGYLGTLWYFRQKQSLLPAANLYALTTTFSTVAPCLRSSVRSVDTVARLGGDEFAIVLHGIETSETADFMVEKIRAVLHEPLLVDQHSLYATGSIGVAVAPDQGLDVDHLLRKADDPMYRAKETRSRALAV